MRRCSFINWFLKLFILSYLIMSLLHKTLFCAGQMHESAFVEELQAQHATLRGCIEQLTSVESWRASLVSNLREALQEQVCQPHYSVVAKILQLWLNVNLTFIFLSFRNLSWLKFVMSFRFVIVTHSNEFHGNIYIHNTLTPVKKLIEIWHLFQINL